MKLIARDFDKDGSGRVDIQPENSEDLWHLFNLIAVGDRIKCSTIRKVIQESATGTTAAQKRHIVVQIRVDTIDYDAAGGELRVKGQNQLESEFIKMGAYHTCEIEVNRKLTLEKSAWDAVHLETLEEACDETRHADLAAVIMQEGLANVCLITPNLTLVRQKIETNIPRKRKAGASSHDKGMQRFYENILQAIRRHVRWDVVKVVLLASPGFVKDDFFKFMLEEAQKREFKELLENKAKFVLCHASSGFKHSLKEVLEDKAVAAKLSTTKFASESKALDDFFEILANTPERAVYGPDYCLKAADRDAIETLLISDALFRSQDLSVRRRYVALVEKVRETNGEVKIFSSMHITGEQLGQVSGIAAILRFPCPEIDDEIEAEEQARLAALHAAERDPPAPAAPAAPAPPAAPQEEFDDDDFI
eukprot:TRINITY_DN6219_c0_g1_i1.p1 TRINITY_DN6219_c0_g1~~TRINITY_DN6219_c0_g1_i1.p1  ORF type:complete len:421 (+),score=98.76 TRINITY_DN6219_c0_g1_i1:99-1361(+)